ncbi:MAG TPA: sensor histidine kinase, partial [Polyangiales bacterium]
GPLLSTCALLGVYALGIWVLLRRPEQRRAVISALTVLSLLAIVAAVIHWGVETPPPNLVYLPGLAYIGICISSPALSLSLFVFCLLLIGGVALAGAGDHVTHMQLLLDLALVTSVYQVGWYLMEQRVRQTLTQLERRARELRELETFRTRVCGTLFHDVANPAQVLGMLIDMAGDGALAKHDLVRARRLLTRLSLLVRAALAVLAGREPGSTPELRSVPLSTLFEELEELFAHRLAAKGQRLCVLSGSDLVVRAAPELLRDSVLANLVSNAIKFSVRDAAIELSAQRVDGQVEIAVRDRGPGFSGELIERLEDGVRPLSTPGSAGETGLGLGLTLASEHVRSMGGRLMLRRAAQGGEAAVRLPSSSGEPGGLVG